jgi:hypothetical protein
LLKEFVFGHDPVAVLEKVSQHLKHFGFDRDHMICPPQFTASFIECKVAEAVYHDHLYTNI